MVGQAPTPRGARRGLQREQLGVGGGVAIAFAAVVGAGDDLAGREAHDDRADGHVVVLGRPSRLTQRMLHPAMLVVIAGRGVSHPRRNLGAGERAQSSASIV